MAAQAWRSRYRALQIGELEDGIVEVILHNPPTLNSVTAQAHAELAQVWRDLDTDEDVRVVLVRGAGAPSLRAGTSNSSRTSSGTSGCGCGCGRRHAIWSTTS